MRPGTNCSFNPTLPISSCALFFAAGLLCNVLFVGWNA
jgi:hypothetical protein